MLVIDTSIAVKWVVPETGRGLEDDTDIALGLLTSTMIAPDCIAAEFANAMFKKVTASEIGRDQALAAINILPDIIAMVPTPALLESAFHLAVLLSHPVHDCAFLALALQQHGKLITADMKFVTRCRVSGADFPVYALREQNWS